MEKSRINKTEHISLEKNPVERLLKFIEIYGQLKTTYRSNFVTQEKRESVAEHCWRVALLVMLVAPSLDRKIDVEKALKMALIHDLAESIIGDTDILALFEDEGVNTAKIQNEKNLFCKMSKVIGEELGNEILNLWVEFEENFTYEAKTINALDKIESQMQQNETKSTKWKELEKSGKLSYLESFCDFDSFLKNFKDAVNLRRTK